MTFWDFLNRNSYWVWLLFVIGIVAFSGVGRTHGCHIQLGSDHAYVGPDAPDSGK